MARWEANPRERLVEAALDLFAEQGYERTSVPQIAERAGLTKSTFFRHFADKREALFVGHDLLREAYTGGIAAAPSDAAPLRALAAGLRAVGEVYPADLRTLGPRRRTVIADNPELQEREALKRAQLAAAIEQALRARGLAEPAACVAATLGVRAFSTTFERWSMPGQRRTFDRVADQVIRELSDALDALR